MKRVLLFPLLFLSLFASAQNSWNSADSLLAWGGRTAQMYYASNPLGGTYTVTATFGANSQWRSLVVCEYSGLASSSVLDTGTGLGTGTACTTPNTSCTTSAFSTTNANDLVVVMGTILATSNTFSVGPIGAQTPSLRTTNSNDQAAEDTTFSSAQGSITAKLTSTSSDSWGLSVGAFKIATTPAFNTCWGANEAVPSTNTIGVPVSPAGGSGHLLVAYARQATNGTNTISLGDNASSSRRRVVVVANR